MRVAPFAHAANVDKILPQQLLVLAIAQFVAAGDTGLPRALRGFPRGRVLGLAPACLAQPFPQFQVTREFTFIVVKFGVCLVCLRLSLHRSVPHVLHRQGTGNHQNFVQSLPVASLQNHASNSGVQRQF